MQISINKATVLVEALPYITKFHKSIVVIKYGGSAMLEPSLVNKVAQDISLLKYVGMRPIVVHGGGKDISHWLDKLGVVSQFVDGLRVTSPEAMEITEMVLVGKVKKGIMQGIVTAGANCVGLSGKDGQLIVASQKSEHLGLVGNIESINTKILHTLLANDYIPVISPIGVDNSNNSYNINADTAAAAIASAMQADKLILLTDVLGILDKQQKLIQRVRLAEIDQLIANHIITGGMIPKLQAAKKALEQVKSVHIINGTIEHAILLEICTDNGIGTMVSG